MKRVGIPRYRFVVVLLGGVLAIAVPTVIALVAGEPAPESRSAAPAPTPSPTVHVCGADGGPTVDNQECQRRAKDFAARKALTEADRDAAAARLPDARAAIDSVACANGGCDHSEIQPRGGPAPDPVQLELSRRALAAAGFEDVTVRQARPDDPAPAGTVVYAAGIGPACIFIVRRTPNSAGTEQILGRLPDGHCLAA
jgi:hypothetical protein